MAKVNYLIFLFLSLPFYSFSQCAEGESSIEINVYFDYYSNENSFTLVSNTSGITYLNESGFSYEASDYSNSLCLPPGLYTFTMLDSWGDGQSGSWSSSDGSVHLNLDGVGIFNDSGNWGTITSHTFMVESTGTEGCTDENYFEFDDEATIDDGSCITLMVIGCTDDDYLEHFNFVEIEEGVYEIIIDTSYLEPNIEDGSCETLMIKGCVDSLYLEYNADANVHDQSLCDNLIIEGCTNYLYLEFSIDANLDDGSCENLVVFGCTNELACNFEILANVDSGSCDYEDANENGICDSEELLGCTNPEASNYSTIATIDDGSCIIYGCTYNTACNYSLTATDSDGSCIFPEIGYNCSGDCIIDSDEDGVCDDFEIIGCINPIACNFDPEATDESTCTYPELYYDCSEACITDTDGDGICDELEIIDCLDPEACNYNSSATEEGICNYETEIYDCYGLCWNDSDSDGVCDELEVLGCSDPTACNYDSLATEEVSCEYTELYYNCDGTCNFDVDEDGICDELEINGCTDEEACNYNSAATNDNDSCEYVEVSLEYNYTSFLLTATTNVEPPNYQWSVNGETVLNTSDRINVYVDGSYTVNVYDEENDCWGEATYNIEDVSIAEIRTEMSIYPNPSNSILNIVSNKADYSITSIEIYNLQGQICLTEYESNKMITIESLMPGHYILKLNTNESSNFQKFLKTD
jgi:hypothetical protein